ncbi:hypothetical protein Q5741_00950 [Paenibacillus sp. JX-17]|uniref:Uncharacterized protein n=1 Tax=Paenibacillus lacisoli TaxID=3064525 RepID=A0ABT9CAD0_9BACL|nr:hypothetical protein [Paenibacillus sp. JX-17]MDO7904977.1 hypothetical protein [Paenibacillus sp. JX-17]
MDVMAFNDWGSFWGVFRLSILSSLLGALIGHYSKNGVIQLPLFVIPYERGEWVTAILGHVSISWVRLILNIILTPMDFVRFLLGIRWSQEQAGKRAYFELGLLGDILIGIGTGVLAKTATEMAQTQNVFAEMSAAFIAGFAGLSYIRERQRKDLDPGDSEGKLDPSIVALPMDHRGLAAPNPEEGEKSLLAVKNSSDDKRLTSEEPKDRGSSFSDSC